MRAHCMICLISTTYLPAVSTPICSSTDGASQPPGTCAGTFPTTWTRPWLTLLAAPPDMEDLRDLETCTHDNRPQNMPITPHESATMHRLTYNRARAAMGGVINASLVSITPPSAGREALAGPRSPAQLTSFCPAPSTHLMMMPFICSCRNKK